MTDAGHGESIAGAAHAYRTVDVPVAGGALRVGIWEPQGEARATALLIHGVTASHRAWPFVVARFPDVRFIAPDLRGRGRSNRVAGPAGMAAHATDLAAVLDALELDRVPVIGHSMGAFVAVSFAGRFPDRVSQLLLVDGGLPLDVPAGLDPETLVAHILGPTAERLSMRFPSTEDYLAFWRNHPAFAKDWSRELEDYLAYDLEPDGEAFRPATSYATTMDDTVDLNTGSAVPDALAVLAHPTAFVTVPRGLQDEEPGLYAAAHAERLAATYPVEHTRLPGLNHYTIVMAPAGAEALEPFVEAVLHD